MVLVALVAHKMQAVNLLKGGILVLTFNLVLAVVGAAVTLGLPMTLVGAEVLGVVQVLARLGLSQPIMIMFLP